ncbi:hypothetical protein ACQFX9_24170 [Aliinostoc sp. HNIBRCY26]
MLLTNTQALTAALESPITNLWEKFFWGRKPATRTFVLGKLRQHTI